MTRPYHTSRGAEIALDGLDDLTIEMFARFVLEAKTEEDDLERRLTMSTFAERCGVLDKLRDKIEELGA